MPENSKLKQMKTYYVNIRGLKSKKESLEEVLDEVKPDIIGLVETHMEQGEELRIEGYHIIRKDRNGQGGGLLIAVKDQYIDNVVKREEDKTTPSLIFHCHGSSWRRRLIRCCLHLHLLHLPLLEAQGTRSEATPPMDKS